jgi:hypothetical protein
MTLEIGDRVIVTWGGASAREYGTVIASPEKKRYEVLFEDGVSWVIPSYNIIRVRQEKQP